MKTAYRDGSGSVSRPVFCIFGFWSIIALETDCCVGVRKKAKKDALAGMEAFFGQEAMECREL
jgi:hypothetical protein